MGFPRRVIIQWSVIAAGFFTLILAVGFAVLHSIDFSIDRDDLDELFANGPYPLTLHTVSAAGRTIEATSVGDPTRPPVVLIHGTPGSWDNFAPLMANPTLLESAFLVSLDRPGFGGSGRGNAEPSLARQAQAVAAVIKEAAGANPTILVGHSLGGPIAIRTAADHPGLVAGVILVAPSVDPDLEELWWIQRPADSRWLAWLVPVDLRTCNREILPLEDELREMLAVWDQLEIPITVIQGTEDRLVPAANAEFVRRVATAAPLHVTVVPGLDHFIPWTHPELIVSALFEMLAEVDRSEGHQSHPDG